MRTAIFIGGSGYIGGFILRDFLNAKKFDKYLVWDIRDLTGFNEEITSGEVVFERVDVRNTLPEIPFDINGEQSWLFNLAAVHREPGHAFKEYFDTNIPGANNVVRFADENGIRNIFFTSSIAPYGRSMEVRTERSNLYPETGYGISKALAEQIHIRWQIGDAANRLIIVRPSVIYGPADPGNVYRMIGALKKGVFIIPGKGDVIKAYGYIYGLVESINFVMALKKNPIVYNYTENPVVPLREMVGITKSFLGIKKPTLKIPVSMLVLLAYVIQAFAKLVGKKSDIHPVRVKKAGFPTNIKPLFLLENGFDFKYDFKSSLKHWKMKQPGDFD